MPILYGLAAKNASHFGLGRLAKGLTAFPRGFVSNRGMETPNHPAPATDTEQRLMALEIKATYTEDLLEQLDQVVVRQQRQIEALLQAVAELKASRVRDGDVTAGLSLRDELPPHF